MYRFGGTPIGEAHRLMADGAILSCHSVRGGQHTYAVRDGVLLALERSGNRGDEMLWGFVATAERQGLVDIRIGNTAEVIFSEPFDEVLAVTLSTLPFRTPRPDYGKYAVEWGVINLRPTGFSLVSSYRSQSLRTEDRAFLVGWRAFGRMPSDPRPPIWREMLANAHRHLLEQRWHLALLETAFALESFIDSTATNELTSRNVPTSFIHEALREDDFRVTLRAVKEMRQYPDLSGKAIDRLAGELKEEVFGPRNGVAHGSSPLHSITEAVARRGLSKVQRVIWDWAPELRMSLLLLERSRSLLDLRDCDDLALVHETDALHEHR